jgi:TolB-like protein
LERITLRWKGKIIGILICLIFGLGRAFAADNQLATNIANLAKLVTKQFGAVEARVAAIQGDRIYLNAGKSQYVKIGAVYEIIDEDKNKPVIDPSTRRKIGTLETHVAEIKITTVRDNLAIGQIIEKAGSAELKIGQKAVQKPKMLSIAVIQFDYLNSRDKVTPKIAQALMISELIKTGQFMVADSLRTGQIVNQLSSTSQPGSVQFTKAAGKLLGVDYIMYGFITDLPGFMDIQCRIHDSDTGIGLASGNVQLVAPTPPAPQ